MKQKLENELKAASQSLESKILSLNLQPEESLREQPAVPHEMISVSPDSDVIVR